MYGSKKRCGRNAAFRIRKYVRLSKNFYYERPCGVTGTAKHTGSEGHLRVYEQIGILERGKVGMWSLVMGCEALTGKAVMYNLP
jgi:hypothetical protein